MMNKKAFTLIEMLIVVVLMGIIMTLAIPSVMKIMDSRLSDEVKTHTKLLEQAANLYKYRYRGEFNNNPEAQCFIVNYKTLLDEKLLDEQDIKCNGVIVYKRNSKTDFTKSYFLNCSDKNGAQIKNYKQTDVPTGCVDLDIDQQEIPESNDIMPPIIGGGNNNWVSTDIDIIILGDIVGKDHNEYYISENGATPSKYVTPTGIKSTPTTSEKAVTISENGIHYVWVRTVDKNGNISDWSNRQVANIDKETPAVPIITASDNITSGNLHTKNFVLTFGGGNNISGNSYYYGTTSNPTTMATSVAITPEDDGKKIYVKSCSGANICSDTKTYIVNIKIPPVVDPALIE